MKLAADDYILVDCVLRSDVLRSRARGLLRSEAETQITKIIEPIWLQVCRDALIGTYSDYTDALFTTNRDEDYAKLKADTEAAVRIKPEFVAADLDAGILPFRLELQAKWFGELRVGLQHLIHVLCGDLFNRAVADIRGSVEVKSVVLGRFGEQIAQHFRESSNDIKKIRTLFALEAAPLIFAKKETGRLPLLAFSLKPRNGLDRHNFKRIATGVLRAGFNIVETDVRNIDFMEEGWRAAFIEVAKAAVEIKTHVARFSLTLNGPADLAIQFAEKFRAVHPDSGPWVIKVDGGLDGLSTIQALRTAFKGQNQPIITCYPILGSTLTSRIGADTFRDMLIMSGADIIYPGNAPRIGDGDFIDYERSERGVRQYKRMIDQGWPMPSIAGGVHAGQLPAYYEMLGPEVSYFLGGGVALHLNGPYFNPDEATNENAKKAKPATIPTPIRPDQRVGGAELCRFAIEAAALLPGDAKLSNALAYAREHYVKFKDGDKDTRFQFVDPKTVLVGRIKSFRDELK